MVPCTQEGTLGDADVRPNGRQGAFGALTDALHKVLKGPAMMNSPRRLTWRQLLIQLEYNLRDFSQIPQISSEKSLDLDSIVDF